MKIVFCHFNLDSRKLFYPKEIFREINLQLKIFFSVCLSEKFREIIFDILKSLINEGKLFLHKYFVKSII